MGPETWRSRWQAIWVAMEQSGLAALIVAGRGSIGMYGYLFYVGGYVPIQRFAYAVILPSREPIFVVGRQVDVWHIAHMGLISEVSLATHRLADAVGEVLERSAITGLVGLAGFAEVIPGAALADLVARCSNCQFVDSDNLIAGLKAVKSEVEIGEIRRTVAIADAGLAAARDIARVGCTGWALSGEVERAVRNEGARDSIVFVDSRPYTVGFPLPTPIEAGTLVSVVVEIVGPGGYWVERGHLFAFGDLDMATERLAESCLHASERAVRAMRPGRSALDVVAAIQDGLPSDGEFLGALSGHGVGIDHDPPALDGRDSSLLRKGMVLAVHPNLISADHRIGAMVADTVVVTSAGSESLSQLRPGLVRVRG